MMSRGSLLLIALLLLLLLVALARPRDTRPRPSGDARVLGSEARDRGLEGGLREHQPVVHEDVVGVELVRSDELHARPEVAERLPRRLVGGIDHDEDALIALALGAQPERRERLDRVLGARDVERPLVDHEHLALGRAVGQRGAKGEADHLLRGALRVAPRLRAVRHAAATPVRRADRALAGAAGALLAPRLRTTTGHFGPRLGALRPRPGGREL